MPKRIHTTKPVKRKKQVARSARRMARDLARYIFLHDIRKSKQMRGRIVNRYLSNKHAADINVILAEFEKGDTPEVQREKQLRRKVDTFRAESETKLRTTENFSESLNTLKQMHGQGKQVQKELVRLESRVQMVLTTVQRAKKLIRNAILEGLLSRKQAPNYGQNLRHLQEEIDYLAEVLAEIRKFKKSI